MITDKKTETVEEFQKSQIIRLVDVFVIAPTLIYASSRKELPDPLRASLFIIGGATAVYNGANYIKNLKK